MGRTAFADRAIALDPTTTAPSASAASSAASSPRRARLRSRVLDRSAHDIYAGGRSDIAAHRINVRVLVLLATWRRPTDRSPSRASTAATGSTPARVVISAHKYGLAVDIAALGGTSILGHQDPGGLTERQCGTSSCCRSS